MFTDVAVTVGTTVGTQTSFFNLCYKGKGDFV